MSAAELQDCPTAQPNREWLCSGYSQAIVFDNNLQILTFNTI
jgi:hypothetical protein